MSNHVLGIHHVTAMAGDPQKNINFYAGVLGLRMVKKTVNFDDPYTYHFYYGDEHGNPGTIMTFFPWNRNGLRGRRGTGQLSVTGFSVPQNSLKYWADRLKELNVHFAGPYTRFDEEVITLFDPDELELELVASTAEQRVGWKNGVIPPEHAVRGFYGVTLSISSYEKTALLMTDTLGFRELKKDGNRFRYDSGEGGPGTIVDILWQPDGFPGTVGVGAVHHVAWRVKNDDTQLNMRRTLLKEGYNVTPVMDRNYFHSIYFRDPGQVLFEIATDPPGFTVDEKPEELGRGLKLPLWLESSRGEIEERLVPVVLPG